MLSNKNTASPSQRGFTLIELVIAITVISIAVTGVMAALSSVAMRSAQGLILEQANTIADAYLEEIRSKPFQDPDGVSGETTRALFDDIQDYNGLTDVGARDQRGVALAGLDQYTITVRLTATALSVIPATDVRRVDVSVRHRNGVTVNLSSYQTRHS
jgi:MSHA pilin protein MshD